MPAVTRWMIRAALAWLITGLLVDTALGLGSLDGDAPAVAARLRVPLLHGWLLGWVVQLILGVAWWLFPKRTGGGRGSERLAATAAVVLNGGLVARVVAEPMLSQPWAPPTYALAAVLQLAGVSAFAVLLWPRVRGPR